MPRTTLDIDAFVLAELRHRQRQQGGTLGELASALLGQALADQDEQLKSEPLRWRSQKMGARIDLDDKDAVGRALGDR